MQAKELNTRFTSLLSIVSITFISNIALAAKHEIVICHHAHNGDSSATINIAESSLSAHLAHGDAVGACIPPAAPEVVAEPEVPAEPEVVAEPQVPTEPEVVAEPEVPTEPEVVTEPEAPSEPEVVAEPEVPTDPETVTEEVAQNEASNSNSQADNNSGSDSEAVISDAVGGNEEHHTSTVHLGPNNQIGGLTPEQLQDQVASFMMVGIEGGCSQSTNGQSTSSLMVFALALSFFFFRKRKQAVKQ